MFDAILREASQGNRERAWHGVARRALHDLPERMGGLAVRSGFFLYWSSMARVRDPGRLASVVETTHRFLGDHRTRHERLSVWRWALSSTEDQIIETRNDPTPGGTDAVSYFYEGGTGSLESRFLAGELGAVRLADLFRLLGLVSAFDRRVAALVSSFRLAQDLVARLLVTAGDVEYAMSVVKSLASRKVLGRTANFDGTDVVESAVALSAGRPDLASMMIERLVTNALQRQVDWIGSLASVPWLRDVLVGLLLEGGIQPLREMGEFIRFLDAVSPGASARVLGELPRHGGRQMGAWWKTYPPELHPVLIDLDRTDPKADRTAPRILAEDWPDPDRLRIEIEWMRRQIPGTTGQRREELEKRLAKQERRLTGATPQPTPLRLRNLEGKLRRRVCNLSLQWALIGLRAEIVARVSETIGADPTGTPDVAAWVKKEWTTSEPMMRLLAAVFALQPRYRRLGLALLREAARRNATRTEALIEPFRDHPRNRAFVNRMTAMGVRMAPWLGESPPCPPAASPVPAAVETDAIGTAATSITPEEPVTLREHLKDGTSVTLSIERDPIEILRMGERFDTCLSPGRFNFQSAVINAVDVNKRVVHAREPGGRVVGRCLLALTPRGKLLSFHVYATVGAAEIPAIMAAFIGQLASQMATSHVISGTVEELVEEGWWDDGPQDITGRLAFLAKGTPFRNSVKSTTPEFFRPCILEHLGGEQLQAPVLERIIEVLADEKRPDLTSPIVEDILCAAPDLLDRSRVQAAFLVRSAGHASVARQLLLPVMRPFKRRQSCGWLAVDLARELVALDEPSVALRVLRDDGPRGVWSWADEQDDDRLAIAAEAYRSLGRPRRAMALESIRRRRGFT